MIALLALVALAAEPEVEITPILQVRPRFEIDSGRDGAAGGGGWFVTQRARLGVQAAWGPLSARVVAQDVRRWGEEGHTLTDYQADGFDLHEGYVRIAHDKLIVATLGRQEWVVHEERLIGAVDFPSQGRAFDGARVALASGLGAGDLAVARLADPGTAAHPDGGGVLSWLRAGATGDTWQADALAILDTDVASDRVRATLGAWSYAKAGAFSGRVEGYGQIGAIGPEAIGAWMAGARFTWAPDASLHPTVTLWYDHLSGDADPAAGPVHAFDTLYATNHKFYGLMDIAVFRVGGAVDGRGLQDVALKLSMKPHERVDLSLDTHGFLASAAQGGTIEIGEEMDLLVKVTIIKPLSVHAAAAAFRWPGGAIDGWGYVQVDAHL